MIHRLLRALRCYFRRCPGYVISGWKGDSLYIGWRCSDCGKVKNYEPSGVRRDRP